MKLPLATAGLGALACSAACATQPLWELGIGAGALHLPHYRGSDQSHQWVLPVPYAVYRGEILRANRDGARAVLLDSQRLDIDVSVGATAPTRSAGNRARQGMADLAGTLEVGPNVNLTLAQGSGWKLDLRLPVHAVATLNRDFRSLGWTATPLLNVDHRLGPWNVGVQAAAMFGSAAYHRHFYGVAAADATPDRPAFEARGGYAGWRATVGVSRRFEQFWLGAYLRHDSVAGARFVSSPLVRQTQTVSGGLALSWVWLSSTERVHARE